MLYQRDFFDAGIDRKGTACEKWDDRAVLAEDAVPLWVADMDFRCAEPISRALAARAAHACYGYTMVEDEDVHAMLSFVERRHQLTMKPEECVMLPCVVTGLKLFVRCFSAPGDRVAMLTPVYGPFREAVEANGRALMSVPLPRGRDNRYLFSADSLAHAYA